MRHADECRLAVGFFDGVHRGHQAILADADVALTFRVHPLSVLKPSCAPCLLMSLDERVAAIRSCGVADVRVLAFTPELASTSAEDFVSVLKGCCPAESRLVVRCGDNWRFGENGSGDAEFLRARGVGVEVVPYAEVRGEPVSSSRIRRCLGLGDVISANEQLGRPYSVSGEIVRGKGLGRSLGFPTLNVRLDRPLCLRPGVYAVRVAAEKGIANYGVAPTLGKAAWPSPVLEVHLLAGPVIPDAASLTVEFERFIRDERKFATVDELVSQITEDCDAVMKGES